jgi:hypothetical protein
MAELLASSSTVNNENELVSTKSNQDDPSTIKDPEPTSSDSPRMHSKLLHRRIVTMLETLTKPTEDSSTLPLTTSHTEHKSQPITFGQLRQATISSSSTIIIDEKINSQQQIKSDTEEQHRKTLTLFARNNRSNLSSNKSPTKHQTNKTQLYYSPSLEQLFQQQNVVSQTEEEQKDEQQQSQKTSLTVDEILAMYYSKVNLPTTNTESHLSSSSYSNTTTGFYIHPSGPRWNTLQTNQHNIPPPPRLMLNEQNRNRPPPPSYSSSIAYSHRTSSTGM